LAGAGDRINPNIIDSVANSPLDGSEALITGASAGLGLALALRLAPRVRTLHLVARDPVRLERAAEAVRAAGLASGARLETWPCDLSDPGAIGSLADRIARCPIDLLVNNAAAGDLGRASTLPPGRAGLMIHLNILAPVLLTRAALPGMLQRGRGHLLNVSSTVSALPAPGRVLYAASKGFLDVYTEGLRAEIAGSGVVVTLLRPGPMETGFLAAAAREQVASAGMLNRLLTVAIDEVARAGLEALERGRARTTPGLGCRALLAIASALPHGLRHLLLRRLAGPTGRPGAGYEDSADVP